MCDEEWCNGCGEHSYFCECDGLIQTTKLSNTKKKEKKKTSKVSLPKIIREDFALLYHQEDGLYSCLVHNVLDNYQCLQLISSVEGTHEEALTNIGGGNMQNEINFRLSKQIDMINYEITRSIFEKLQSVNALPIIYKNHILSRIYPKIHFLRYTNGGFFRPHKDGHYAILTPEYDNTKDEEKSDISQNESMKKFNDYSEISLITIQLYLTDSNDKNKGHTRFFFNDNVSDDESVDIQPKIGSCVVFDQDIMHEGIPFVSSSDCPVKDTIRMEVMYEPDPTCSPEIIPRISINGVVDVSEYNSST